MKELVSILIPVYNRVTLIEETVRSALAQRYEHIEVIVVDNASTDGSWELLGRLAAEDARLHIHRNAKNIGPVRNWLRCLSHAKGELTKILWSDDLIDPDYLTETVPLLRNPDVGFAYSPANVFNQESGETTKVLYRGPGEGIHPSSVYIDGALFFGGDVPMSPGCALFRTADLRRCLKEQVPNRIGSDFSIHAIGNDLLAFLLVAREYSRFAVTARPLSHFRHHAGSITSSSSAAKLVLHYDVARAHFVETTPALPKAKVDRFNACLWLRLRRVDGSPFGLKRLEDFYTEQDRVSAKVLPVLRELLRALKRRLA